MVENKTYTVYRHVSPDGKSYVGLTKKNPIERWGYNGNGYHNQYFNKAIKKYGWDNIKHEILYTNLSLDEACQKEIDCIRKYNSYVAGYNQTFGGECDTSNPVIFINTGEVFEDIYIASKNFNIPYTTIRGYCNSNAISSRYDENGRYYCFAYYYPYKTYSIKDYIISKHRDSTIICLESGELYINAQEIERMTGLFATNIHKVCKRKYDNCGGLHFMYYKEYLEKGELYKTKKINTPRKVICLNNLTIYNSINKASIYYNVSHHGISLCCENKQTYAGIYNNEKLVWQYYDEYLINPKDINSIKYHNGGKKVLCVDTGEIFNSVIQASQIKKVDKTGISNCCLQKQKTCGGYRWKYLQEEDDG